MASNLDKDRWFCEQVKNGRLRITKSGKVYNLKMGRECKYKTWPGGYHSIGLWDIDASTSKWIFVHRLVWCYFKGVPTDATLHVNHINGIKSINAVSNLELVTPSENSLHAYRTGLHSAVGQRNGYSKFSDDQVARIRKKFASGKGAYSLSRVANYYDVTLSTIYDLLVANTYSHVSDRYVAECRNLLSKVGNVSDTEIRYIQKLSRQGNSVYRIAQLVGRHYFTVKKYVGATMPAQDQDQDKN